MTFSELKKKDIICIGDGRLIGRVSDLEFEPGDGRIRALIVPGSSGLSCFFHGDKNQMTIAWQQIACIGDDVILISPGGCC
ncbi:MAG: YlmC/YmxH family sporulation protein [Clostridia bacterium]|nr:YlmC/YmxH family sporulation protein [Clostridia bacterium]